MWEKWEEAGNIIKIHLLGILKELIFKKLKMIYSRKV